MDYVFSSNSLSGQLQRIFARMPSDFERQATDDTNDFHSNGIDRDFEPKLSDQSLSLSPQNNSDDEDPAPKVYYLPVSLRRPYAARTTEASVSSQSGWQRQTACVFCRNNGEPEKWYRTHLVRDLTGRVTCPVLRAYRCPICGSTGDTAHTLKYCPLNKIPVNVPLPSLEFDVERNAYLWLNSMENPDFNVSNSKDGEISCWSNLQSRSVYSLGGNE